MALASSDDGQKSPPLPSSAYVALEGGAFASTDLTRGPWHPDHQHGGPPIALVALQLLGSILAYPVVVALSGLLFGLRKTAPGQTDSLGRRI